MKRFLVLLLALSSTVLALGAGDPDDQYLQIYGLIQEGDSLSAEPTEALSKYLEAQTALEKFQKANPDWNTKVIVFRQNYLSARIAALSSGKTHNAGVAGAATNAPAPPADWESQMNRLKEQVRQLDAEKVILEAKLKEAFALRPAASDPQELTRAEEKIRALEKENGLLKVTLGQKPGAASPSDPNAREVAPVRGGNTPADADALRVEAALLQRQLGTLQARLAVLEAHPVPYAAEELALLKAAEPKLTVPAPATTATAPELAAPAAPTANPAKLIGEAQKYYAARQFDEAERVYLELARQNPKSVPILGNLAAIQLELNHLAPAEQNLQVALVLAPDDVFSLIVLGKVKMRQGDYSAALDTLSRAAKLEPNNAEIHNFLGITLSEKGQRAPAEAAFRKAVELQPDYADAHNNLAVFYITQQPPYAGLARWHYDKAIAAGHARNPELEKLLAAAK